jgi:hypothetical protein
MPTLLDQAANAGALRYLAHGRPADEADARLPTPEVDRWHLGTHPDIVERLWDVLNAVLPADARRLVYDGPALVHPSGVLLAAGVGTQYVLRLLAPARGLAIQAGAEVVHHFRTVDTTLDLAATFGPEWVFGRYDEREPSWLLDSYRSIPE